VAVFTGTSSQLADFYQDFPGSQTSRDPEAPYYDSGTSLYKPFIELNTIGVFAKQSDEEAGRDQRSTEFRRSVRYGRPLFALMNQEARLEGSLKGIERRLRIIPKETLPLEEDLLGCLSILGSRIQMGQSPLPVTSTLVPRGYACINYVGLQKVNGDFCVLAQSSFQPDPVCSFLATRIMSDCEDMDGEGLKAGRRGWSAKVIELFSTGLCSPSRGSVGEIATAIYMLFCGDVLRSKIDGRMETFSVPLHDWVALLISPSESVDLKQSASNIELYINFIQVCQNYFLLSPQEMGTNYAFLEQLYKS